MPVGSQSLGRRRFVQLMGWAGVATMARGGPALAQAAAKTRGTAPPPAQTSPTPPAEAPPALSAEAKALAEVARARYQLSADETAAVAKEIDGDLRSMERLRQAKLTNADEPDFSFHA